MDWTRAALAGALASVLACAPASEPVTAEPGEPLPGLTEDQRGRFAAGRDVFERTVTPEAGLGPLYNGEGCGHCHAAPVTGGSGFRFPVVKATAYETGACDLLIGEGGDNIQQRVTAALGGHGITRERVPDRANGTARMSAPALFGAGLLEAIRDATILAREDPDDADGDGISGRAGRTADGGVGRFGRKAEAATAQDFIDTALRFELGLTTPTNPFEERPNGAPLPEGTDPAPEPEIGERDLARLADYVRFLAPPAAEAATGASSDSIIQGNRVFDEIGCARCHVPTLQTGDHEVAALSRRIVPLYSDMLLHDMGPERAGVCGPDAAPTEYVSARLWGLRHRTLYMHDAQTASIEEAIELHGGEAIASRDEWRALDPGRRQLLVRFLLSL